MKEKREFDATQVMNFYKQYFVDGEEYMLEDLDKAYQKSQKTPEEFNWNEPKKETQGYKNNLELWAL